MTGAADTAVTPEGGAPSLPPVDVLVEAVGQLALALAVPILVLVVAWVFLERIAALLAQAATALLGKRDPVSSRVHTGREGMIGQVGVARTGLEPDGKVFVRGELWNGVSEATPVSAGQAVEVIAIEGLTLRVRPHFVNHDVDDDVAAS